MVAIIKDQLLDDMKIAMKAKDAETLSALRFLWAEIKNNEIDGGQSDDQTVQKIVVSQIKKMKDAINDFKKAKRIDLISAEEKKIITLEKYLPPQLSDQTLKQIIEIVLTKQNPPYHQGKIIGQVMLEVKGQADGRRVKEILQEIMLVNKK